MRTTLWHVDNATKEQIMSEYNRIQNKTSTLSRKFRDLIIAKVKKNKWNDSNQNN